MNNALTIVDAKTPALKKKREKICLIETQPEADWFVPAKTTRGRQVWYLRFQMTGWNPRLFGPFKSKRHGLLFLDDAINCLQEIESEMVDAANKRIVEEPCSNAWLPIVEHPIVARAKAASAKGLADDLISDSQTRFRDGMGEDPQRLTHRKLAKAKGELQEK